MLSHKEGAMGRSVSSKSLWDRLKEIPDPRGRQGRQYALHGLLGMLVLGALHGERSLRGMWLWGCKHWHEVAQPLGLWGHPQPPAYGTVWYVLSTLDEKALEKAVRTWVGDWMEERSTTVSIKVLRSSQRMEPRQRALEIVRAISQELKRVLEQGNVARDGQISAAIRLLRAVPLKGQWMVADVSLLRRPLIDTLVKTGGD